MKRRNLHAYQKLVKPGVEVFFWRTSKGYFSDGVRSDGRINECLPKGKQDFIQPTLRESKFRFFQEVRALSVGSKEHGGEILYLDV